MSDPTSVCSWGDCGLPVAYRELCSGHAARARTGKPMDSPIRARRKKGEPRAECSFPGCDRKVKTMRLCKTHYENSLAGKPLAPIGVPKVRSTVCAIPDCGRPRASMGNALLCGSHDQRKRKYGDPLAGPPVGAYKRSAGLSCSHPGCDRAAARSGMCFAHYQRSMDGRPMDEPIAEKVAGLSYERNVGLPCSAGDCGNPASRKGMCDAHYRSITGQGARSGMKRRSRKMQAPYETITAEDLRALRAATDTCYLCGEPLADPVEFDHVIPLSRGGHHLLANICPVHKHCNRVKHARLLVPEGR